MRTGLRAELEVREEEHVCVEVGNGPADSGGYAAGMPFAEPRSIDQDGPTPQCDAKL